MKRLIYVATFTVILGLVGGLAYGGFYLKRWFNYKFGYGSQVEETVKKLVKPECLN